jgi:hypothetical protein
MSTQMRCPESLLSHLAYGYPVVAVKAEVPLHGAQIGVYACTPGEHMNGFTIQVNYPEPEERPDISVEYQPPSGSFKGLLSIKTAYTYDNVGGLGLLPTSTFTDVKNAIASSEPALAGLLEPIIMDEANSYNYLFTYTDNGYMFGGVDGTVCNDPPQALYDENFLYLCVGKATVSDQSNWKKIPLLALDA